MKKREIALGMVLDTTLSFACVYPQIYYILEKLLRTLDDSIRKQEDITIRYGITLLKNRALPGIEEKAFTEDIEEVMQVLRTIAFARGGEDGTEDLAAGMRLQLRRLNSEVPMDAQRGLLLFTDSVPDDEDYSPDYSAYQGGIDDNVNHGLRFAYIFSYDEEYMPVLRMVDDKGALTENEMNQCVYGSLKDILLADEDETIRSTERWAKRILEQCK